MSIIPTYERLAKQSVINPSPELIALKDAVARLTELELRCRELETERDAAYAKGVEDGIERVREEHEHGHCCRRNCDSPSEMCNLALETWLAEQNGGVT